MIINELPHELHIMENKTRTYLVPGIICHTMTTRTRTTSTQITIFFYIRTSGTPEICQLPAGMADKNKLVLYPLY